ncbi:MAG: hypothetical protein ACJA0J_001946, partial [Bdellovibrionota bacterium]
DAAGPSGIVLLIRTYTLLLFENERQGDREA